MTKRFINPLVSVVIPVFNEEKYLDYCLSSLSSQTYLNTEVVIVDDGSTDGSRQICEKYNFKVLFQNHAGPGAARNLGVKSSRGKIIVFVDADMKFDKDFIKYLVEPIIAKRAVGTFVKQEFVANTDNIWSQCWSINSGLPFDRRIPEDYGDTENVFRAILKSTFVKGGGFEIDDGYSDDSSLSRKINKFAVNAPNAICYHFNPSSLSEVFYSARWIGRSVLFKPDFFSFLRYTPLNSLRVSFKYLFRGAPLRIIFFKFVYDFGMLSGIFLNKGKRAK